MKSAVFALISAALLCAACQGVPRAFSDDGEFGAFARAAKGRYLGVYGYAVAVPGVSGWSDKYLPEKVYVIPGTSDFWRTPEEKSYNERAWKFAEKYNAWLRSKKTPNKAPEPTPGPVTIRAEGAFEMISSRKARLAPGPVVAHL